MRYLLTLMLAGGSLWAATDATPATYMIGNIDGLSAGDEGTLRMFSDQAIFRSGKTVITVRFSKITQTELGPLTTHASDIPLYKVWQLHKRFLTDKTVYRDLTLSFRDLSGNDQNLTLEIEQTTAGDIQNTIEIARGKRPAHPAPLQWWGQDLWRTSRTNQGWDKRAADAAADEQIRRNMEIEAQPKPPAGASDEKPASAAEDKPANTEDKPASK